MRTRRADERHGGVSAPVKINCCDAAEFKAGGEGLSATSKVLRGAGIALGDTPFGVGQAFGNLHHKLGR